MMGAIATSSGNGTSHFICGSASQFMRGRSCCVEVPRPVPEREVPRRRGPRSGFVNAIPDIGRTSYLAAVAAEDPSKFGRFIQTYSGFLSSFVIGVAGLIATSIWQYRQSQIAVEQTHSEQAAAHAKADSDWRIARAEILGKNLNVLSAQGAGTADQRFGVLLSLTRGNIIDPELAVSYALELGRDNANYMRSVLASTTDKNYSQLLQAFKLTCLQRFGVERAAEICKDDKLADRSDAIAQLFEDELEAAASVGQVARGPMALLREERQVQSVPGKVSWLFEPYLQDLYERRQWTDIERFQNTSVGAKLVAALVLATARTGELVGSTESARIDAFHSQLRKWLIGYLTGQTCDSDCRGRLVDVMLSSYGEAQGDYDDSLKKLMLQPRGEAGPTLAHLHARLLWCQVDGDDLALFRDQVLVPAVTQALAQPVKKNEATMVEDLIGLAALVPEPADAGSNKPIADPAAAKSVAGWKAMLAALASASAPGGPGGAVGDRFQRVFSARRSSARRERQNPPPMIKKVSFCNVADNAGSTPSMEQ